MLDTATTHRVLLRGLVLMAVTVGAVRLAGATVPNVAICNAAFNQMAPSAVSNGAGGALIAWTDLRSGDSDIYLQQTNSVGQPLWSANGVPVCKAAGVQQFPRVIADGAGGAIVVWQDNRGADQDIYAQRVSGSGAVAWAIDGVPVCTTSGIQELAQIVPDGAGGAIIAWIDRRNTAADIFVQHLSVMGTATWTAGGVALCTATGDQTDLTLSSDGAGGAIALWRDGRVPLTTDIYAQKVGSSGTVQWAPDGVAVCNATDDQQMPAGIADGAGGLLATWSDHRSGNWDIYAQRLSGAGAPSWTADGVGVCASVGDQTAPKLCGDGAGGAILAWEDRRGADSDIYTQRMNVSGVAVWAANGAVVCTATADQVTPAIVPDNMGGALISWSDGRTPANGMDVYGQRVGAAAGGPVWAANGVVLCDTLADQLSPGVVHDGEGGAIVAWRDFRPGSNNTDVFAQHVDAGGLVQGQCPDTIGTLSANSVVTALSAYNYYNLPVPITFYWSGVGVRGSGSDWDVEWYESFSYPLAPYPICFANSLAGSNGSAGVDLVVTSFETNRTPSNNTFGIRASRFAGSGNGSVEWDLKAVTIVKDGAGVSSGNNWIQLLDVYDVRLVQGQTYTFDFTHTGGDIKLLLFTSNGVSGPYSAGRADAVFEAKDRYTVYTAPATEYYGVVLVNDNGVAGTYNVKVLTGIPVGVSGGAPKESALMGVAPNPAHGKTAFRFSLRDAGDVSFRVLDMAGRVIGTIPTQRWQPGTWSVQWDGRASDGRSVAAGVYFVQMELDGRRLGQQRMALVR